MTVPRICLCTLALNEIEWLGKLYLQHKDWPGLVKWVFVESADVVYARENPELVTDRGLSTDGTSEFLAALGDSDPRIHYIPHGTCSSPNPAQGKCQARNRYLDACESVEPDYLIVLDCDEFHPYSSQRKALWIMEEECEYDGFCFRHRDIWHPPSIQHKPLFRYEVVGGFWSIPYCRHWRWYPGLRYVSNHNTPEKGGVGLDRRLQRYDETPGMPDYVHMAFASSLQSRQAKHRYYVARGEGRTDHRQPYVESRAAYETWKPGQRLPHNGKILAYRGEIPECFQVEADSRGVKLR